MLFILVRTAETHRAHIMQKLDSEVEMGRSRALCARARSHRIVLVELTAGRVNET